MDRERIVTIFFFGFLALMAYELYALMTPFLTPVIWAILLAFIAHPAVVHLHRHVKSRTNCAIIITAAVTLGVMIPAVWVSERLAIEAQSLYTQLSDFVSNGGIAKLNDWIAQSPIAPILHRFSGRTFKIETDIPKLAADGAQYVSQYLLKNATSAAKNAFSFVFDFGLVLLIFFYLLRDGEAWFETIQHLTPLHDEDKAAVFDTLRKTLSSVMRGLLLTSIAQGLSIGIGLLITGTPYWAALAIVAAIAGMLPFGGTALVWVPASVYLLYTSGWTMAIVLLVWCVVAVGIIDSFLKPLAMRHGTELPTILLFFGIAGGLSAYGPLGLFAGPAIISVFVALLRVYSKTYISEQRPRPRKVLP